MLVIPAIDLRNHKVVRLFQGDYEKTKVYGEDPEEYARFFKQEGAKRLHIVDLDGAKEGYPVHQDLIIKITQNLDIPVQVGGGIRTEEHVETYLKKGVSQVILGTKAVSSLDWLKSLCSKHPKKIIVSVDVRGDKVAIAGWIKTSDIDYLEFIQSLNGLDLFAIILTLIERDGTQKGVETERLEKALQVSAHPIILAGGVSTLEDIKKLKAYEKEGLIGVITGRALYEGTLNLKEALQIAQ
ncbi:1-(5-phosphoribosyl)-5-[(5-phosphoribosylamino)methylideneamino]imidazole-4-carboxamide isomerase [Thermodesulfobacterium sp. TA1]|uniref:1-(5-phosphoribosyl)-5-[(5- phosphoribosylamino)methylideneamino]imidazole-4- carboxamide isomerase n=1 Tax=Thermodesulfobacterium sp. TA1 TaxID=2234087 RepID=UPI0012326EEB|nr:1-(5-phosphoribosyl)-5-[(5-phosphoribosylamino)methylideneamino]imidazole-4-carboxamide isomerase [Thermodesulfobacterium sp. TA1]QER41500.1 1-(5-phosphoribosyl)-5-[(5-phosphoribosylamino)methylideneamino]imidazole-4-carboxamide isomerase [Thermodesulfobacterium sp. TA1]